MATNRNNNRFTIRKNSRGFSLAEMIVVLSIMAILAASGIITSIGYVNRATFNQNESNAETIYHAAQTGLQSMEKSGKISSWVSGSLLGCADEFEYKAQNQSSNISLESKFIQDDFDKFDHLKALPNSSVHMRYIVTYNPTHSDNAQSKLLKALIQPYFYDATIFNGTITIEFDVEKGVDSYKTLHYSAKCLSVFINSKAHDGWKESENAFDDGGKTDVPTRAFNFRRRTSRIGYYDGYSGTSVDTVYLPQLQEGIVVKKLTSEYLTETETEGEGESAVEVEKTHTWLTWSATLDKKPLMGANKDVYHRLSLSKDTDIKRVLILNDDFMIDGQNITIKNANDFLALKDKVKDEDLDGHTVKVDEITVVYQDEDGKTVTKKSITFIAQVFVRNTDNDGYRALNKADIEEKLIKIPMKISYVSGEYDEKLQPKEGYYEYSLDLSRAVDKSDNPVDLISDVNKAVLTIHPNYFSDETDMTGVNDSEGIIALKKESTTTVEQVTDPATTP